MSFTALLITMIIHYTLITIGASKFAPHLEKCLGMGRSSTRLAHKKTTQVSVESEGDQSDDNEDDWTYPSEKKSIYNISLF